MGFSIAGAFAVICISLFIAIEIFSSNLFPMVSDVTFSYHDMKDRAVDEIQTNINITNVTITYGAGTYDLNISVENTGSIAINTSDFTILINGTSQQFNCTNSYAYPEKVVYFTLNSLVGTGTKKLKAITENGISDYYEYIV